MKQIRVLQKVKLLGKNRKYNDMLTEEEFYSITPNVRQSLLSSNTLEVYDDGSNASVSMQQLNARVDLLSDILQDQLGIKLGDYFDSKKSSEGSKKESVSKSKSKSKSKKESKKEYAKGDTVFFMNEDEVSTEGTVDKVYKRKKMLDVETEDGVYEVSFNDIVTED